VYPELISPTANAPRKPGQHSRSREGDNVAASFDDASAPGFKPMPDFGTQTMILDEKKEGESEVGEDVVGLDDYEDDAASDRSPSPSPKKEAGFQPMPEFATQTSISKGER